jgi:solute:Na+ symporter, SSS family
MIASATIVAKNIVRGLNPGMSDGTVTSLTKALVPVIALGAVAFVFAGGQTIVTLLLLGYALVTQLFPRSCSLSRGRRGSTATAPWPASSRASA